ncbi:MAG: hypothetical protein ACJAUP_003140 [Cellvibrionaceae bacterium]|jgi:hypothetical protein
MCAIYSYFGVLASDEFNKHINLINQTLLSAYSTTMQSKKLLYTYINYKASSPKKEIMMDITGANLLD